MSKSKQTKYQLRQAPRRPGRTLDLKPLDFEHRFIDDLTGACAPLDLLWHSEKLSIEVERWIEPTSPDPQELKTRLGGEGYSVFQRSDAPGTKYGPHAHAEDQTHWILSR